MRSGMGKRRATTALLLAALLLWSAAGCRGTGEDSEQSTPSEEELEEVSQISKGPIQLIFTDPEGYKRELEEQKVIYTTGEDGKIILTGDKSDTAVIERVLEAVNTGDYSPLETVLAESFLTGEYTKSYAGGHPALLVAGEPVKGNNNAIQGGAAYLAVIPMDTDLVVVEAYCTAEYREQMERDLRLFLDGAQSVPLEIALEESLIETGGEGKEHGGEEVAGMEQPDPVLEESQDDEGAREELAAEEANDAKEAPQP